ncbi:MAG: hypothetical protein ACRES3_03380, partial [Steroidobacteraceae bacterium]
MRKFFCFCALSFALIANADTTLQYNVLFAGTKGGAQTTVIGDDGRVRVSYSHRDNGRGPDLEEEISIADDGTIQSYRLRGKTTYGAVLDERFSLKNGRASWRSASERGAQEIGTPAIYVPNYGSPEINAIIARATQRAAGGRLAALPGGELHGMKLKEARVGPAGQQRAVALYAIFGLGLQPDYVWLDADAGMRLFASINVGGSHVIASGFESHSPELEGLQQTAEADYLRGIAQKHARHFPGPILIRNVRVFDTIKAALGELADVYVHFSRIAAIYPAGSTAGQVASVIEGAGRALLPGLFD